MVFFLKPMFLLFLAGSLTSCEEGVTVDNEDISTLKEEYTEQEEEQGEEQAFALTSDDSMSASKSSQIRWPKSKRVSSFDLKVSSDPEGETLVFLVEDLTTNEFNLTMVQAGTFYIHVIAKLKNGKTWTATKQIVVESTEANTVLVTNHSLSFSSSIVNSSSVTLTLAATDADQMYITNTADCSSGGSWETYLTSKAWTLSQTNATATVYAKFKSSTDNESTCVSGTVTHDDTAPSSTSIAIDSGAATTNNTSVTLTLAATGADEMYVSNTSGCGSGGAWETYATSKAWTLGQANTTATVYVKFRDTATNETSCISDTITHDSSGPTSPTISIDSGAAYATSTSVTLSLSATDDTEMYVTNTAGCSGGGSWESSAGSKAWTLGQTNATATVYVKYRDASTNESSCVSDTITHDDSGPTSTSISIDSAAAYTTSTSVTLTLAATDAAEMYVTNTAACGSGGSWEAYATSKAWTLGQTEATATVYIKYKDAAGNVSSCINDTIIHDNTAPTSTSISIDSGATYATSTSVTLTLAATGSSEMYVTNTAACGSGGSWETYATSKAWTLGQTEATATVYIKYKDAAGNESSCINDTVIHDNTAPTSTSISISGGAAYATSTSVTLTLAATDASDMYVTDTAACGSGGAWESYGTSKAWTLGQTNATATVYVKFKDAAGNESSCINDTITHDDTAPGAFSVTSSGTDTDKTPAITWGASSDAVDYDLVLSSSSDCSTSVETSNGETGTSYTVTTTLTRFTAYFVCITANDVAGNTTDATNNAMVLLITLEDGAQKITSQNFEKRPSARETSEYGYAVDVSPDGNLMAVGARYSTVDGSSADPLARSGSVYVYEKSGGSWSLQQTITATGTNARLKEDMFGQSVALSNDTLIVGAPNNSYNASGGSVKFSAGAAFIYKLSAGSWSLEQKIVAEGTNARSYKDDFGWSVDIDGDRVIVGDPYHDWNESGASKLANAGAVYIYDRSGSTWTLDEKLVASGTNARVASNYFGYQVSVSGTTVAVTSYNHKYDASGADIKTNAGAVFIYVKSGTWALEQKLVGTGPNGRDLHDFFGWSVSLDADTVAIGSKYQGKDAAGGTPVTRAGAVYVFTRSGSTWSLEQKLIHSNRNTYDYFGWSVDLVGDGLLVGANQFDYDAGGINSKDNAGAAFYFTRSGTTWSEQAILVPSESDRVAGDYFGASLGLSATSIVVGAYKHDFDGAGANEIVSSGAAFTYDVSGATVTLNAKHVADTKSEHFKAGAAFTSSMAISEDGQTLVIGEPNDSYAGSDLTDYVYGAGSAHVYTKQNGLWIFEQKLYASDRAEDDKFGASVDISGDTIVVGAYQHDLNDVGASSIHNTGAAYVFKKTAGTWAQEAKLSASGTNSRKSSDWFGNKVAISGDYIAVGSYKSNYDASGANSKSDAGNAYVFVRSGSTWSQQARLAPSADRTASDYFGIAIDIDDDTLIVGAYGHDLDAAGGDSKSLAGAAWVFRRSGTTWSEEQKLVGEGTNGRNASDRFGISVSIDGDAVAIGASYHAYDDAGANSVGGSGAIFVYNRSGSTWSYTQRLTPTGTNARTTNARLGHSCVMIQGSTLITGAHANGYTASGTSLKSSAGAGFVFTLSGGTWSQTERYSAPASENARNQSDYFGTRCSISSDDAVFGSNIHKYDITGTTATDHQGAAFSYPR